MMTIMMIMLINVIRISVSVDMMSRYSYLMHQRVEAPVQRSYYPRPVKQMWSNQNSLILDPL